MKSLTLKYILREKKCKKCGKPFFAAAEHRYKAGGAYYCSWTCYLHRKDNWQREVKP